MIRERPVKGSSKDELTDDDEDEDEEEEEENGKDSPSLLSVGSLLSF